MAAVNKYVANLVLDGELWERCPCVLVPYKVELQAAVLCGGRGRAAEDRRHCPPYTSSLRYQCLQVG